MSVKLPLVMEINVQFLAWNPLLSSVEAAPSVTEN